MPRELKFILWTDSYEFYTDFNTNYLNKEFVEGNYIVSDIRLLGVPKPMGLPVFGTPQRYIINNIPNIQEVSFEIFNGSLIDYDYLLIYYSQVQVNNIVIRLFIDAYNNSLNSTSDIDLLERKRIVKAVPVISDKFSKDFNQNSTTLQNPSVQSIVGTIDENSAKLNDVISLSKYKKITPYPLSDNVFEKIFILDNITIATTRDNEWKSSVLRKLYYQYNLEFENISNIANLNSYINSVQRDIPLIVDIIRSKAPDFGFGTPTSDRRSDILDIGDYIFNNKQDHQKLILASDFEINTSDPQWVRIDLSIPVSTSTNITSRKVDAYIPDINIDTFTVILDAYLRGVDSTISDIDRGPFDYSGSINFPKWKVAWYTPDIQNRPEALIAKNALMEAMDIFHVETMIEINEPSDKIDVDYVVNALLDAKIELIIGIINIASIGLTTLDEKFFDIIFKLDTEADELERKNRVPQGTYPRLVTILLINTMQVGLVDQVLKYTETPNFYSTIAEYSALISKLPDVLKVLNIYRYIRYLIYSINKFDSGDVPKNHIGVSKGILGYLELILSPINTKENESVGQKLISRLPYELLGTLLYASVRPVPVEDLWHITLANWLATNLVALTSIDGSISGAVSQVSGNADSLISKIEYERNKIIRKAEELRQFGLSAYAIHKNPHATAWTPILKAILDWLADIQIINPIFNINYRLDPYIIYSKNINI